LPRTVDMRRNESRARRQRVGGEALCSEFGAVTGTGVMWRIYMSCESSVALLLPVRRDTQRSAGM
jgi:hypothetical protein